MFGFGTAVEKPEGGAIATDWRRHRLPGPRGVQGLRPGLQHHRGDDRGQRGRSTSAKFSRELAKALQESKGDLPRRHLQQGRDRRLRAGRRRHAALRLASLCDRRRLEQSAGLAGRPVRGVARAAPDPDAPGEGRSGQPDPAQSKNIVVAPKNEYVAIRLLRSTNQSGTANNDVNAIRSLGRLPTDPMVMTRLTQDACFIHTDAEHGLMH